MVHAMEPGVVIGTIDYCARQGTGGRHWYNGLVVHASETGGVIGKIDYRSRQGTWGRHWENGLWCTPGNLHLIFTIRAY